MLTLPIYSFAFRRMLLERRSREGEDPRSESYTASFDILQLKFQVLVMALELVGGAVLGVVFDQLRNEICRVKNNVVTFKPKLEELEETLEVLYPVIQEIEELNRRLNRPNHGRETMILRRLLEDGTQLVSKCSKVSRWDFLKQSRYREKLMELDNKILRFHNIYMQAHMGRDQKQTLLFMQETRQMLIMSLNQLGFSNLTMGLTASTTDSSNLTMGLTASTTDCSNLTMGLTVSATDSSVQQKIVLHVRMDCEGCRRQVVKLTSLIEGVSSIAFERVKNLVVVTGHGIDAVKLTSSLKKRDAGAAIVSVEALTGVHMMERDRDTVIPYRPLPEMMSRRYSRPMSYPVSMVSPSRQGSRHPPMFQKKTGRPFLLSGKRKIRVRLRATSRVRTKKILIGRRE